MPILDPNSFEFISRSADQTRRVGMRLGALLGPRAVVGFTGDLGAGKTTFIQGLAAGWGSLDPVTSPTFVLVNVYRRLDRQRLYHLDAYRLQGPADAEDLDLEAMLETGPLVVEWADKIKAVLPVENLWISMRLISLDQRDLIFVAKGAQYQALMAAFRRKIYGSA